MKKSRPIPSILLFSILFTGCTNVPISEHTSAAADYKEENEKFAKESPMKLSDVIVKKEPTTLLKLNTNQKHHFSGTDPVLESDLVAGKYSHYLLGKINIEKPGTIILKGYSSLSKRYMGNALSYFKPKIHLLSPSHQIIPLKLNFGICDILCLTVKLKMEGKVKISEAGKYKVLISGDHDSNNLFILQHSGSNGNGIGATPFSNPFFAAYEGELEFSLNQ
jgi:hypothetical protein